MPKQRIEKVLYLDKAKKKGAKDVSSRENEVDGCRSLRRGLDVLELICKSGLDGLRVVEICSSLELERAPVHRMLHTLLQTGYVERLGRFQYVATSKLTVPARETVDRVLVAKLQPVLKEVSERLGDAAFLVVREENISHCIARQLGSHPLQALPISIGNRQPLGVGAAGLALLSAMTDEELAKVVKLSASVLEQYGGMTTARLDLLVKATRERGWSVVANHATQGILGVGIAVLSKAGVPIGAISVASTLERMPRERQKLTANTIIDVIKKYYPRGI